MIIKLHLSGMIHIIDATIVVRWYILLTLPLLSSGIYYVSGRPRLLSELNWLGEQYVSTHELLQEIINFVNSLYQEVFLVFFLKFPSLYNHCR